MPVKNVFILFSVPVPIKTTVGFPVEEISSHFLSIWPHKKWDPQTIIIGKRFCLELCFNLEKWLITDTRQYRIDNVCIVINHTVLACSDTQYISKEYNAMMRKKKWPTRTCMNQLVMAQSYFNLQNSNPYLGSVSALCFCFAI